MDRYADFSTGNVVKVHSNQLEEFYHIAAANQEKKRYRLCLHDAPGNKLQEMMICKTNKDYGPPHKHQHIAESHILLQGKELVILFSSDGNVEDAFILDPNNDFLSYRINTDVYHMSIVLSDYSVDYEVKVGPFDPNDNIIPDWAPNIDDKAAVADFVKKVRESAENILENKR